MKKLLCGCLIAALVTTTGITGFMPAKVHAGTTDGKAFSKQQKAREKVKYKEGEAIVLLKGKTATSKAKASSALSLGDNISVAEFWNFDTSKKAAAKNKKAAAKGALNIVLVKSKKLTTKQLIKQLKQNSKVKTAEPNYRVRATGITNDTYIDQQWGLENKGQNRGTAGAAINVSKAWETVKSTDKVVAIVDTGVDYRHEDLAGNIWENPFQPALKGEHGFDFINGDDDPYDDNGHGSHCAGIIGAMGNNNLGVSGVNQKVKIMALKFLDSDGNGWGSDEVSAYNYINKAINMGANVVAINNSWGGGEPSEIFAQLIDFVGEKGAVTVCAAGNDGYDIDDTDEEEADIDYEDEGISAYPAGIESDYNVSVAASNEKNELAGFSNYGKKSVDLAAPGADILSTVSYPCFNPTTYGKAAAEKSAYFADYEAASLNEMKWGVPAVAQGTNCTFSIDSGDSFGTTEGKSLKVNISRAKSGEAVVLRVPYELSAINDLKNLPQVSAMVKVKGPDGVTINEETSLFLSDIEQGKVIKSVDNLMEEDEYVGVSVLQENNFWTHLNMTIDTKKKEPQKRELIFLLDCCQNGDYEIHIDNLGISKENLPQQQLGKYDYYNGTSMATPYVTGAVALTAAMNPDLAADQLVGKIYASVKKEKGLEGKLATGGVLDFTKVTAPNPRVRTATVDLKKKQIHIKGNGLTDTQTVQINGTAAKILSVSDREISIQDNNWINKKVKMTITKKNGQTATKENLYLVNGKTPYTLIKGVEAENRIDNLTTDGNTLYLGSSEDGTIYRYDSKSKEDAFVSVSSINADRFFTKDESVLADREFSFGRDLVYMDGKLYNIGAVSEVAASNGDGNDLEGLISEEPERAPTSYTADYRLLTVDLKTKKAASLGQLPKDFKRIEYQTAAAYNGKLYFIGGYDYKSKSFTNLVKIYDPQTKKWSSGPKLPEGRAAGKAMQVGNSLVYTLGYTDQKQCPKNLILTGGKWKRSAAVIKPYQTGKQILSGKEFTFYDGSIGVCSAGIAYSGIPAEGLGDTFVYDVKADRFVSTAYNQITELNKQTFRGTVAGSTLYGFDENMQMLKSSVKSGLVKVTAGKLKGGTIKGANKGYLPGAKVTLTAAPSKGYAVKSFTVNGQKVKGKSKTLRLTKNIRAKATFSKRAASGKSHNKNHSLK